jgi:threonine/homoserine/homoserine lactone efflux protein
VAIGGGAASVDMTYAVTAALGWRPLIDRPGVSTALTVAGVALLLYLAGLCFRGVWQAVQSRRGGAGPEVADRFAPDASDGATAASGAGLRATYVTGLLMTFFNPMTLAFWFVVLPGMAANLTEQPRRDLPLLCAGVFVGAFGWAVSFSAVLALLGRFKRNLWALAADAVGGVMLLGFAAVAAGRLVRPWLFR